MRRVLGDIVDELGVLRETIKRLQEKEAELKDLLTLTHYPEIRGMQFAATFSFTSRAYLDNAKVRLLLTPEQLADCTKVTEVFIVRTKRIDPINGVQYDTIGPSNIN